MIEKKWQMLRINTSLIPDDNAWSDIEEYVKHACTLYNKLSVSEAAVTEGGGPWMARVCVQMNSENAEQMDRHTQV